MKRRRLNWRVPEPNKWRYGGFKQHSGETHGDVKTVYSRDFPAIEGSKQCAKCRSAYSAQLDKCPVCPR
jgi:hypothetical protein